jgi:hypothetical protein
MIYSLFRYNILLYIMLKFIIRLNPINFFFSDNTMVQDTCNLRIWRFLWFKSSHGPTWWDVLFVFDELEFALYWCLNLFFIIIMFGDFLCAFRYLELDFNYCEVFYLMDVWCNVRDCYADIEDFNLGEGICGY